MTVDKVMTLSCLFIDDLIDFFPYVRIRSFIAFNRT